MSFRVLFAIMIFSISTPAFAQFGERGGFGSGVGDFNIMNKSYGDFGDIVMKLSKSGRSVTAFSAVTGKASKKTFDQKIEPFVPLMTSHVACFMHKKTAYVFSAQTGKWDSVKTENGTWIPVASGSMLCFVDGKTAYAVGKNGKWLQVETDGVPVQVMALSTVSFQIGSKFYICSDASTEWQVIDLENDE